MIRALKAVVTMGFAFMLTSAAKAGPDVASLCERRIILSTYFTPNLSAEKSYATTVFEYSFHYCASRLDQLYVEYRLPEWPLQAGAIPRMVDINAVSILGVEKDALYAGDDLLVLSIDETRIREAIEDAEEAAGFEREALLQEVVRLLNMTFDEVRQQAGNPPSGLRVQANKEHLQKMGFTDAILGQLNGEWVFEQ